MKTITFYAGSNRSGDLLHIETDGCVVNVHVGLHTTSGQQVTRVDVIPDDRKRGGDGSGGIWNADGMTAVRVIRAERCTGCGAHIHANDDGVWVADHIVCPRSDDRRHHPGPR